MSGLWRSLPAARPRSVTARLRPAVLADQFNRIAIGQLPPPCASIDHVQQTAEIEPRLRRQGPAITAAGLRFPQGRVEADPRSMKRGSQPRAAARILLSALSRCDDVKSGRTLLDFGPVAMRADNLLLTSFS